MGSAIFLWACVFAAAGIFLAVCAQFVRGLHIDHNSPGGKSDYGPCSCTGWKWAMRIAAVFLLVILFPLMIFVGMNGVQSTGTTLVNQANTQFVNDQNILSNYVNGFYEQLGVANLQSQKLDNIIVNAVSAQFDLHSWASNPKSNPLFAALSEAYPQVNLDYGQIINYIAQGRAQFQAAQTQLLADLQQIDQFRETGLFFHPLVVALVGFPGNDLKAQFGNQTLYGSAAEAAMWKLVNNPQAVQEIQSGIGNPLTVPSN